MGSYIKGLLITGNITMGILLVDNVQPIIAVGFILVNVFLLFLLLAQTSRYLHNRQ